jgi:hypothetical protein
MDLREHLTCLKGQWNQLERHATRGEYRVKRTGLFIVATVVILGVFPTWAQLTPDPISLLNQMYAASGGERWSQLERADLRGTYSIGGLSGTFKQKIDLKHGGDVSIYNGGPLDGRQGTQPEASWSSDSSGIVTVQDAPEAKADAITQSYEDRNGWFHPQEAAVSYIERKTDSATSYDLVRVVPPGGRDLTLWIDVKDHLLRRIAQKGADQQESITVFSDYRQVDGVLYPFSVRSSTGDPSQDVLLSVQEIQFSPNVDVADFAPPASVIRDAELLGDAKEAPVPFTVSDGRIVVEVSINGKPPLPFLLDSGAMNMLTPDGARQLGVAGRGDLAAGGVGNAQVTAKLARVKEMKIGRAHLSDQQFIIIPLPSSVVEHGNQSPVVGLIGYELLRRFAARIDYQKQTVTFYKPGSKIDKPSNSEALRMYFNDRTPFIQVGVDGTPAYFGVDTGDNGAATLFKPFYQAHLFPVQLPGIARKQRGIGGEAASLLTRVESLSFGSYTLTRPLVELNFANSGIFAMPLTGGNLGYKVFRNFILTFDYEHRLLYLEKSVEYGRAMRYNHSGLTLDRAEDGSIVVTTVDPHTPAADAGLEAGDRVLALNGKTPNGKALYEFGDVLSDAAGKMVEIRFIREGKEQHKTFVLRNLIPVEGAFRAYTGSAIH